MCVFIMIFTALSFLRLIYGTFSCEEGMPLRLYPRKVSQIFKFLLDRGASTTAELTVKDELENPSKLL